MASALLVIDMQNDFCDKESPLFVEGSTAAVGNVSRAVGSARKAGVPVLWVCREHDPSGVDVEAFRAHLFQGDGKGICIPGSDGAAITKGLSIKHGETKIIKKRMSSFFGTPLDVQLRRLGVKNVVICGVQTPNCIRATAFDAVALDYYTTVLADATGSKDERVQEANLLDMADAGISIVSVAEWGNKVGPDDAPASDIVYKGPTPPTGIKKRRERKPRERKPRERKPRERKPKGEGEGSAEEGAKAEEGGDGAEADAGEEKEMGGDNSLEIEVASVNIKRIDMKAYGINHPKCQVTLKCGDLEQKTSEQPGLDPVWEETFKFKVAPGSKISAVLHCEGIKIGDECVFLLDKLVKGKPTFKGLIVPGGKVDMMFKAEDFGLEEEDKGDDGFMDFL